MSFRPIPIPTMMDYRSWASRVRDSYPSAVPLPGPEHLWYQFAVAVYSSPTFARFNVPNPYVYTSWRDWAFDFWKGVGGQV